MKNKLLFIIIFFRMVSISHAGFVDDWWDQKTETSPGYFEGQKRGYYNGGTFSTRWKNTNDHLFTIERPRIKIGCGGIDAFMGGISFLNADYLVEKGQRIIQSSPFAAMDIAFNVLCEPCNNAMKFGETITNQLNALQINDCMASKAMVATIVKPAFSGRNQAKLANIQGDFMQGSGMKDLWQGIKKDTEANQNKPAANLKQTLQGCPADIKDVFGTAGFVLNNMADKIGIDTNYVNLIRGMIGDIEIIEKPKNFIVGHIAPCEENKGFDLDNFAEGTAFAKDKTGTCSIVTDANRNLKKYVGDKMVNIAAAIKTKNAVITANDKAFLNASPFPLWIILKTAVGTGQEEAILSILSDVVSKAYAHRMLLDLHSKAYNMFEKGKALIMAQKNGAKDGSPAYSCNISLVQDALEGIDEMQEHLFDMKEELKTTYSLSIREVNNILNFVKRMKSFNDISTKKITEIFGSSTAKRMMSN